jgi:hypothetical protein
LRATYQDDVRREPNFRQTSAGSRADQCGLAANGVLDRHAADLRRAREQHTTARALPAISAATAPSRARAATRLASSRFEPMASPPSSAAGATPVPVQPGQITEFLVPRRSNGVSVAP